MVEDDDDQILWRRMVEVVWAKAEKRDEAAATAPRKVSLPIRGHGACSEPATAAISLSSSRTGRRYFSVSADGVVSRNSLSELSLTSSTAPVISAVKGDASANSKPQNGTFDHPAGKEEWRTLVEAHWDRTESTSSMEETANSVEVPAALQGLISSLIEIEDDDEDNDDSDCENRHDDDGTAYDVIAETCKDRSESHIDRAAVSLKRRTSGLEQVGTTEVLVVEADDDGSNTEGQNTAGAEFRSALNDLPDEMNGANSDAFRTVPSLQVCEMQTPNRQMAACQLHSGNAASAQGVKVPAAKVVALTLATTAAHKAKLQVATQPGEAIPPVKPSAPAAKGHDDATMLKHYIVDNRFLRASTQGLGYRFSKRVQDIDKNATAVWGSTVVGVDEGDGWLKVAARYLPMKSGGKLVLTPKVTLARTTSGTLFAPAACPPPRTPAGAFVPRSCAVSGDGSALHGTPPSIQPSLTQSTGHQTAGPVLRRQNSNPAGLFVPRSPAPSSDPLRLRRQNSNPAGLFVPRSQSQASLDSGGLKRRASNSPDGKLESSGSQSLAKKHKQDEQYVGMDTEGRRYDLKTVIVNFANVGASYACKVLGRDKQKGDRLFDWEGVRKCVRHLTQDLGLEVIGVVMENFWAPDNSKDYKIGIPEDIRQMCDSIEETPKLSGRNHKSADDEMTIKCAYRRNCRFMDNDNYRDWKREMRNERCRNWLENCAEMLQMRYFFDTQLGTFDTLDGNIPAGLSSPEKSL